MNQCADSLKENLQRIVPEPLISHRGWLLSHTMRRDRGESPAGPLRLARRNSKPRRRSRGIAACFMMSLHAR